jgi:peptidoglycan glycosyltransferase
LNTGDRAPIGRGIARTGLVLSLLFGLIAVGAGYWQVVRASELSRAADNPLVIAAARDVVRGTIVDRSGTILATNRNDANGEPYRVYADRSLAPLIGYASPVYGTAGLERADNAELSGLGSNNSLEDLLYKLAPRRRQGDDLTLSLSLKLQEAAVKALGTYRGAVVMLDPRTGRVLAMASTPVFDANAIANPTTARAAFARTSAAVGQPFLNRATMGRYVPGSVFKIVTSIAALGSGAINASTSYPQQPAAEGTGLLVSGFRIHDGHHDFTGSQELDYDQAIEVSCNIYFALTGLRTGGAALADWAGRLGFGAPIPFDLPTATSQVTNGGGSFGGGFSDDVELANAAYGQAETLVTPLQMALVAAGVANGGVLMKPELVTAISGPQGGQTIAPQVWRTVVNPAVAGTIGNAMELAVESDWGRIFTTGAAIPGILTAGKTGTAQIGGGAEPNSWFIGYAPANNPEVAIAVIVEQGGHGSARAAPIAGSLMSLWLKTLNP